ncbi:MAG: hypothetical protein KGL00_05150 [Gammaproteobacteria bacterium]|nr:hypothetical protein [Gammaproteobacteria bacterium]
MYGERSEGRRVNGLPESFAELILAAEPERTAQFRKDHAVFQRQLIVTRPDAGVEAREKAGVFMEILL